MKAERILEVLGLVDEKYVDEAAPVSGVIMKARRHRFSRRTFVAVAAVLIVLFSSFSVAMAASEEFRDAVFRFFKIGMSDVVLPVEDEPERPGEVEKIEDSEDTGKSEDIEYIADTSVEGAVRVEYIRMDGNFDYADGIIYLHGDETDEADETDVADVAAYTVENGQLIRLEPHHEAFEYVWNNVTYRIAFDWYEKDGVVYASANDYDLGTSAAWNVAAIEGNVDQVALTLGYGQQIEYTEYLLLYDLRTKKVTALLDGCDELQSRQITQTKLASDLSGVIVNCEFGSDMYYYNVTEQKLISLNDLFRNKNDGSGENAENTEEAESSESDGMKVGDAWFIDDDTICCISADENKMYTGGTVTLSTGAYTEIFTRLPKRGWNSDNGIDFTEGRYGLLVEQNRDTYVVDFKTGERAIVDGFKYPADDAFTSLNRSGDKILFAKNDDSAEGLGVSEIGVLDLEKRTFTLFDREGYEERRENSLGWFDDDTVAIRASTEEYNYMYLITMEKGG